MDTTTKEGLKARLYQLVNEYAERHNWVAIGNLIGGKPREDLQDYIPGYDDGEYYNVKRN